MDNAAAGRTGRAMDVVAQRVGSVVLYGNLLHASDVYIEERRSPYFPLLYDRQILF